MQSIGQSSSAEVNIVAILDWEAFYQLTWWYFAAHYQYLLLLHHLKSIITANQKKMRGFFLWDDSLSNQKALHSFSCTYLQKFIGADLSKILSGTTSFYLKNAKSDNGLSTEWWNKEAGNRNWVSIPPHRQSQGPERSVPLFFWYLHQPVLNCLVSCFLSSDTLDYWA